MALTIIRPGVLDTLQDMGRTGYAVAGINPGGVMDRYAAAVANYLVGNDRNSAVMEMHFPAPQVLFRHDALISVCGADLQPCINEEPIPCWQPVMVRKNGLLHFARRNSGARAYLAVHGGLDCHSWLNSCSTNLKVGAGGYKGRALMKGDVIGLRGQAPNIAIHGPASFRVLPWGIAPHEVYNDAGQLLMMPGPEWHLLSEASMQAITTNRFSIDTRSDRMAYMLASESLQLQQPVEMISSGVQFGTMQLLPNGQLLILMADHQTTGGYPRIGAIIAAHLPKLAQLAGSSFRIAVTDVRTAEQMLFSQERDLRTIQRSCQDHLKQLHV